MVSADPLIASRDIEILAGSRENQDIVRELFFSRGQFFRQDRENRSRLLAEKSLLCDWTRYERHHFDAWFDCTTGRMKRVEWTNLDATKLFSFTAALSYWFVDSFYAPTSFHSTLRFSFDANSLAPRDFKLVYSLQNRSWLRTRKFITLIENCISFPEKLPFFYISSKDLFFLSNSNLHEFLHPFDGKKSIRVAYERSRIFFSKLSL